ncbi:MAG: hypothetical protein WCO60_18615 [Verrucomicrobiota bacterium]
MLHIRTIWDLRELEFGFQKQAVQWVNVIPTPYAALFPTGHPVFFGITVESVREGEKPQE